VQVALFSLSQTELMKRPGNPSKEKIIELLEDRKIWRLLVANNFINISRNFIFFLLWGNLFSSVAGFKVYFRSGSCDLLLLLLFGEVLPKVYARNNIKFAKSIAYPIAILDKLLSPISIPMRDNNSLHNKLGKQKTNFSVDQLS
jgi:Mg2+/Co2+ transporter CorB